MLRYINFCQEDSSTFRTFSTFLGNSVSTSLLTLLRRNGRNTWCSLSTIRCCSSWLSFIVSLLVLEIGIENHFWKSSEQLKTFGRRKLSSAHSSLRLFWSGVPVSNSRCLKSYYLIITLAKPLSLFFILCPSSTTTYYQWCFLRTFRSLMMKSLVVRQTLHLKEVEDINLLIRALSVGLPWYRIIFIEGLQCLNYFYQFGNTLLEATIKKGPFFFLNYMRWEMSAIVWTVFPRPI